MSGCFASATLRAGHITYVVRNCGGTQDIKANVPGLPPQEAPIIFAKKRKLFFSF